VGMSQYGALGKALRGMKAAEILASYYAGLRPVAVPAEQLPGHIRVALGVGQTEATVSGQRRFRVLDGQGQVLAVAASGSWRVLPVQGRQVRVVPPASEAGPPAVEVVGVEPAVPEPGAPVQVHFRLSLAAAVRLTVRVPAAPEVTLDVGLRDAGDHVVTLPPAPAVGDAVATISAEAGLGRAATVPLSYRVAVAARVTTGSATAPPLDVDREATVLATSALAALLLAVVTSQLVRVRRRVG